MHLYNSLRKGQNLKRKNEDEEEELDVEELQEKADALDDDETEMVGSNFVMSHV